MSHYFINIHVGQYAVILKAAHNFVFDKFWLKAN